MLLLNLVFTVLVIASLLPALLWGGWEGRCICVYLIAAGLLTMFSTRSLEPVIGLPAAVALVDAVLAAALLHVAVRTDRYWPLWVFSFHLLSIACFLAWAMVPFVRVTAFDAVASWWSIPELVVIAVGATLDHRFAEVRSDERRGIGEDPGGRAGSA